MKNVLLLLFCIFFWALNFYLGKEAMKYVSPNATAFWRYAFAVLALWMMTSFKIPKWSFLKTHFKGIFLVGFVGLFGFIYFFFQALNHTSAMNGSLIVSLNPAITLILVVLFQDYRPSKAQILGMILSFFGVVYLLTQGNPLLLAQLELNKGDLLFLVSTTLFAIQNVWVGIYAKDMDNLMFTTLTSFACFFGLSLLMIAEPSFPISNLPMNFWLAELGLGVLGTAVAYYCWNHGLKEIGPAKGTLFINLLPLFTAILAIFFGEELYLYHFISMVITVSGVILVQMKK